MHRTAETILSLSAAAGSRPPSRGSAGVWFLALLLLAGIAFAVWWFGLRKPTAESSSLAARVLPADIDVVGGVDVARLLQSPTVRAAAARAGADLDAIDRALREKGVSLSDFRSLVFGGRIQGFAFDDVVVAIEADTDAKAAMAGLQTALAMLPEGMGVDPGQRMVALDDGVVLIGQKTLLDDALAVSRGEAKAFEAGQEPGLDQVRQAVDAGAMIWLAGPLPGHVTDMIPGVALTALGGMPTHLAAAATLEEITELRGAIHIPGADGEKVASALDVALTFAKLRFGPLLRELLENLQLSGSGHNVIGRITVTEAKLLELVQQRTKRD